MHNTLIIGVPAWERWAALRGKGSKRGPERKTSRKREPAGAPAFHLSPSFSKRLDSRPDSKLESGLDSQVEKLSFQPPSFFPNSHLGSRSFAESS